MSHSYARLNPIRRGHGDHTHRCTQLLFGLGGTVHCDLADGAFDVSCGEIGILPREARHYFVGRTEDSQLLVVDLYMDDDIVRQIERLGGHSPTLDDVFVAPRVMALPGELAPMIGTAARQLGQPCRDTRLVAHQWATTFTVQAYEFLQSSPDRFDGRIARFTAFIDSRLGRPPTNTALQQHMYMSSSALNQWCRLCFDQTPQQVVLRRRLAAARERLLTTSSAIARIAHETGFADTPTFTRAFGRVYGLPPGAVRRAARERSQG
ncbi:AraC family transcriptional regulator [Salinisphaera sp. Q1T1-3]|uniref:helix-turn-helix transcriptional regulator n=1 Tax=Salinisphaera sp. Q1T1-3 TaxID=2321229 RepID=UPI000E70F37B|nr:AraC family transcriptional regulator [Salinisphaera sp. Q1T1-3]RJS91863.1 AraC family transcriptional regulator [Salinisphaera sp. Q1T1-3]